MASASASSLRLFRSLALALGFAALLAAAPGANVVPAVAETGAAAGASEVRQEPIEPPEDPAEQPFIPPDEDEEEEEAEDAVPDSLPTALPMKQDSIPPDSLRSGSGSSLPSGAAPAETLGFKPPGVGAAPGAKPVVAPKPKERRTLFGIHPAAIFAVLIAGHILLVGLVTD